MIPFMSALLIIKKISRIRAIVENEMTDTTDTISIVAMLCTLGTLKEIRAAGLLQWDESFLAMVSTLGEADIVKYAHENGCPWNEWTPAGAAKRGYLNIVKYAHENGCPWDIDTLDSAVLNGHWNIVFYYARVEGFEKTCHEFETLLWPLQFLREFRRRWSNVNIRRMGLLLLLRRFQRRFKMRYYALDGKGMQRASDRFDEKRKGKNEE